MAALLNDYSQMTVQSSLHDMLLTGHVSTVTAGTGLSVGDLAAAMPNVMQQLSNVNMLLAMTPVITMIVFTGSYMGMATLAENVSGEDKVSKNTDLAAPSVATQKTAFGVSAPGNASGSYMVTDGATSGLGYSIGNTASLASTAAMSTAATASEAASTATSHAATMTYGALSQHGVKSTAAWKSDDKGSQEVSTAFDHAQKFSSDTGVSMEKRLPYRRPTKAR